MDQVQEQTTVDSTTEEQVESPRHVKSISVIVPVYNDSASILPTKTRLEEVLQKTQWEYEIVFMDDGSTDDAKELLDQHQIHHITHPINRGYGAAIKTGVSASKSDYICIIDCDLTYPPEEIPNLLEHADQYSMVVGARKSIREPAIHGVARKLVDSVLNMSFKQRVLDINSGLRVFKTEVFREYVPSLCDRFSLTASMTFGFMLDGRPIKYVPIQYHERTGKTKVRNLPYAWSFLRSFGRMYRAHLRKNGR